MLLDSFKGGEIMDKKFKKALIKTRTRLGEVRKCSVCHKSFYALPAQVRKAGWGKYCSRKCQGISQINGSIKKCLICGKNIYVTPSDEKLGRGKYCSRKCVAKSQIGKYVGEKGSNWKGGVSSQNEIIRRSYAYKRWRSLVFERDSYTCVICGKKGEVCADHIKPFALYPDLRFDLDNGRTLCLDCHRNTETYGWGILYYKQKKGGESLCHLPKKL